VRVFLILHVERYILFLARLYAHMISFRSEIIDYILLNKIIFFNDSLDPLLIAKHNYADIKEYVSRFNATMLINP